MSWFWTKRIPRALLEIAPLGAFGVHPSLLPRHRGPDPYFWTIDSGDAEAGVTAHRLDVEYDTGDMLGRRAIPLDPAWSSWRLAKRLDRPSLALLRDVARSFASGAPPVAEKQREADATSAPVPDEDMLRIDWTWPTDRIVRRIRAASPWPGAFTWMGDDLVSLLEVREAESFPRALRPGEAATVDGKVLVRTETGAVEILKARLEGDDDEPEVILDPHALSLIMALNR